LSLGSNLIHVGDSPTISLRTWNGLIDEARISSAARSADYVLAEYKTESGSFNAYTPEESIMDILCRSLELYTNPAVASGTPVSSLLLSTSNVQETYQDVNPTIMNPNQILTNNAGEWDFSLLPNNAVANTTYYFRMVYNSGSTLSVYKQLSRH